MIRSLIVSMGADPNGEALRYKAAADRLGGARIRAVTRSTHTYKSLPFDILYAGNGGAIGRLWGEADVVHLNNRPHAYDQFDAGRGKPVLFHHHGTLFRTEPGPLLERGRRAGWLQAASTIDLAEIAPDVVTWLPTVYDLDGLAELREQHRRPDDGVVRIAHAPTFRSIKGTAQIVAAVQTLRDEGLPVELDLIENVRWAECLRRKAGADILVDQLALGYGCNAIEAWGLGLPVVSGLDPVAAAAVNHPLPSTTRDRMLREFGGSMPFYEATAGTIVDALRQMVLSAELRAEWAGIGRLHVERFHAERFALDRLLDLYELAIAGQRREAVA